MATSEQMEAYSQFWSLTLGFAAPFALKAAVKLDIFNIVSKFSSEQGATLDEIIQELRIKHDADSIQAERLFRLLRFLVFKKVLALNGARYGLTPMSRLLVSHGSSSDVFVGGILSFCTSEVTQRSWQHVDAAIKRPGDSNAFVEAHGMEPQDYVAAHPEFWKVIEDFRLSISTATSATITRVYDGFKSVKRLVDVGGDTGSFLAQIVRLYPHIQAVNFDLPRVIANAPAYPGVENVPGDAMDFVPPGDGIFLKSFLHMFADADAAKIVKNCHSALESDGKIIICDMVMDEGKELHLQLDMMFLSGSQRYQRTKAGWKNLLESCGFGSVRFFEADPFSITEAIKN
ncbi:hypothetical protein SELMODRAFT_449343 [Selaginella moellendorffii]|uniref:O-methyltransferase domain-containing protein n=1 Tax=Selaginella moellendorffii TaxID=88036 RepID=D8TF94_SELML|nr:bergaptol O-methyltransferase [Selaginella moellendorffii]EFJ04676.1 hypothetical protein SELMODRAFT_449343 [Selaginella moellendorffii]|eukprot:XP_002994264.1 bergaptol O-methyltransferase [Selaginella moellendorffii]